MQSTILQGYFQDLTNLPLPLLAISSDLWGLPARGSFAVHHCHLLHAQQQSLCCLSVFPGDPLEAHSPSLSLQMAPWAQTTPAASFGSVPVFSVLSMFTGWELQRCQLCSLSSGFCDLRLGQHCSPGFSEPILLKPVQRLPSALAEQCPAGPGWRSLLSPGFCIPSPSCSVLQSFRFRVL